MSEIIYRTYSTTIELSSKDRALKSPRTSEPKLEAGLLVVKEHIITSPKALFIYE